MKKKKELEESETMIELMGCVSQALKKKTVETSDDHFVAQVLCHLRCIPDDIHKEKFKVKVLNDLIELKYSFV